jgi:hypothetical protein
MDNLVTALYGAFYDPTTKTGYITKSISANGTITWNIPCDPNNTTSIAGIPRNSGEGLLCYLLRVNQQFNPASFITLDAVQTLTHKTLTAPVINSGTITGTTLSGCTYSDIVPKATNLAGGGVGYVPYQSASGATSYLAPGTAGYVLATNGVGQAPSWISNSTVSTSANNLTGGAAGNVPYQSSGSTTAFVAAGTSGQVLQSNGTSAPTWANATNANTASAIVKRDASGNFSAGTITANLTGAVTGNASSATNLSAGTSNSIPYQSASGATSYLAAGTAGYVLQTNGSGSAPTWVAANGNFTSNLSVSISSTGIPGGANSSGISPMTAITPRNFMVPGTSIAVQGTGVWSSTLPPIYSANSVTYDNLGGVDNNGATTLLNSAAYSFPVLTYSSAGFNGGTLLTSFSAPNLIVISSGLNFGASTSLSSSTFSLAALKYAGGAITYPACPSFTAVDLPNLLYYNFLTISGAYITSINIPNIIIGGTISITGVTALTTFNFSTPGELKSFYGMILTGSQLNATSIGNILATCAYLDGNNGTVLFAGTLDLSGGSAAGLSALGISTGTVTSANGTTVTITKTTGTIPSVGNTVYVSGSSTASQNGTFTVTAVTSTTFSYLSAGTGTGSTVSFGTNSNASNYTKMVNRGVVLTLNA